MPRLWSETIETHRRAVRDATLDATAALVGEHGLRGVTMSRVAKMIGIGRATLYKYFPDVESILSAWHERQVAHHLEHLEEARHQPGGAGRRLEAVLETFADITRQHHGDHDSELLTLLHRRRPVAEAEQRLRDMIRNLLVEGAEAGEFRDDIPPVELSAYCLHALAAAGSMPSKAAIQRLVAVILAGLRVPE